LEQSPTKAEGIAQRITEAETKSFLGGAKHAAGGRRTYFDFWYDARKRLFTYIRPSRLLRYYKKTVPQLFSFYRTTWTKMRRWIWQILISKQIASPYVYLRLPDPYTFQIIFLSVDLTKWDLKIGLKTGKLILKNWGKTTSKGKSAKTPDKYRK